MVITREEVIQSPIENATVMKLIADGVHITYELTPNDGYVLHDNRSDWVERDEYGNEIGIILGYVQGTVSVAASYDFTANPYELYAVLRSTVPEDQIFGFGDNDTK